MNVVRWVGIIVFLCVIASGCDNRTDKKLMTQQNRDRFSDKDVSRDANFIVHAVDVSYRILEIAQLGEQKLTTPEQQDQAREIMQTQMSVSLKLKTFAESNGMAVQLSGPEDARPAETTLQKLEGKDFEREWARQMQLHHQSLRNDLVKYRRRAGPDLRPALDSAISLLDENKGRILALEQSTEKE